MVNGVSVVLIVRCGASGGGALKLELRRSLGDIKHGMQSAFNLEFYTCIVIV